MLLVGYNSNLGELFASFHDEFETNNLYEYIICNIYINIIIILIIT